MQKEHNLSKNQKIIFDIIDKSGEPMKAYSILFDVQKKGIKAPLQVYRALDKLVEIGKIHKIESRNAFIACQNSSCQIYFYEHEILKRTYSLSVRDKNIATDEINKWLLLKKYKPIRKGG